MIWFLLYLDNIHDQLHAITENLQVLSAEVRSKLQDNVVVSVDGGMLVDRSLRNTQVADVANKVFKYLICHTLMTSSISVATYCKQVLGCGTYVKVGWSTTIPALSVDQMNYHNSADQFL